MDYDLVKTFPVKRTKPKAFDELPVSKLLNYLTRDNIIELIGFPNFSSLNEQVRQQTGKVSLPAVKKMLADNEQFQNHANTKVNDITRQQQSKQNPRNAAVNALCSIDYGVKRPPQQINHANVITVDNIRKEIWYHGGVKDIQKELFPYEWFDSLDKLSETSLPPIKCFFNKLRNTLPSEAEYGHAGTTNYRTLLMTKNNMELLNYVSAYWSTARSIQFYWFCQEQRELTKNFPPLKYLSTISRLGKSRVSTKHVLSRHKKKHKAHNNACLTTLWFSKQAGDVQQFPPNLHKSCSGHKKAYKSSSNYLNTTLKAHPQTLISLCLYETNYLLTPTQEFQ
ncbi:hypothetical protein PROFUN_11433 [Planoprotostelium fungivorum]|uniref:Uncharacterized protein n=1 Tax=Planoprotostelium fungivorum TaxID=1890364 RepID=A0A2P6NA93_9EUKA|nr:hypothetical protein PROFUN_11433 [Planoprotostelium fungivorum]